MTGRPVPPLAVEAAMLRLGATADEAPRETVYSYATRNPRGPRRRSFTDTPGEHVFIDENTADALAAVVQERLRDFAARLQTVKRTLTPHYFTGLLRPHYPLPNGGQ
ncbi:hypothetical protein OV320_8257 [Actinobacteria bacterium OV320]|nr:hypothetical protein OV320_8257 [Actinobacteria bacterium OV320]